MTVTTQLQTINPTQGLTPTGHRAITRSSIEGPNQDKSSVSCVHRRVLHMSKPEQTALGTPVVGYRWSNIDNQGCALATDTIGYIDVGLYPLYPQLFTYHVYCFHTFFACVTFNFLDQLHASCKDCYRLLSFLWFNGKIRAHYKNRKCQSCQSSL